MKNIIIKLFCFLLVLYLSSCNSIDSSIELNNPNPTQTTARVSTITQKEREEEIQGIIYFNCSNKIIRYDLSSDELKNLFYDDPHHIQDLFLAGKNLYFSKTVFIPGISGFGPSEIFRIDGDGNNLEQLTFDEYYDTNFFVSQNSEKLVYSSDRENNPENGRYKLVELNLNDLNQRILFQDNNFIPLLPSPNGEKIIFWKQEKLTQEIFLSDLITGHQTPLNISKPGSDVHFVIWSPNSEQIAVLIEENETDYQKLEIIDYAKNIVITEYPITKIVKGMAWNPNGKQILLSTYDEKNDKLYHLEIFDIASNKISISVELENFIGKKMWNMDGKQVLFETRNENFIDNTYNYKLWVFNVQDESLSLLDEDIKNQLGNWGYSAQWSPDGKSIIYTNYDQTENSSVEYFINSNDLKEIKRITLPCYHVVDVIWTMND